jgi:hypothetical protein
MAIIADFMLVWLPAPTLSYAAAASAGKLNLFARMFAGCPDNAFQKVQPGMPAFTLMQRLGAPVRNGLKLACVGFSASMIGVCMTNALIALRQALDPAFVPLNQSQDVIATSLAYGAYMATSSNIRCVRRCSKLGAVSCCVCVFACVFGCCFQAGGAVRISRVRSHNAVLPAASLRIGHLHQPNFCQQLLHARAGAL